MIVDDSVVSSYKAFSFHKMGFRRFFTTLRKASSSAKGGVVLAFFSLPATGVASASPSKVDPLDIPRSKETLLYTTLLRRRTIFLNGSVDVVSASAIVAQLIYLELDQPGHRSSVIVVVIIAISSFSLPCCAFTLHPFRSAHKPVHYERRRRSLRWTRYL